MKITQLDVLVTGASAGIGKGIALELALAGHQVTITGRNIKTLNKVAEEFEKLNTGSTNSGKIHPKQCDHSDDQQVDKLFSELDNVDILVNNAMSNVKEILSSNAVSFHELDIGQWDRTCNVGLRNHYRCCHLAVNKMVKNSNSNSRDRCRMLINVSSFGSLIPLFTVPYQIGKCAKDRMMEAMAHDLKKLDITCFSFWPGAVATEAVEDLKTEADEKTQNMVKNIWTDQNGVESPRFSGRCLAKIIENFDESLNLNLKSKINGRTILSSEVAYMFGVVDLSGQRPSHFLSVKAMLTMAGYGGVAKMVPEWIKVPKVLFVQQFLRKRFL